MNSTGQRLAEVALLRRLYEIFRFPEAPLIAEIYGGNWLSDVANSLPVLGIDYPDSWNAIQESIVGAEQPNDQISILESLITEYSRLFINSYQGILVSPYGSAYLAGADQVALQVTEWYRRAGVALPPDYPYPPDYLPVELEFLAHLTQLIPEVGTGEAASDLRLVKEEFCRNHFCLWIPSFVWKVVAMSKEPLYVLAAQVLQNFIPYFQARQRI